MPFPHRPDPMAFWRLGLQSGRMLAEAQAVIGMRMLGMAGLWSVTPSENRRMVEEKINAFTRAQTVAGAALMRGKPAAAVAGAALAPYAQATAGNVRRLSRRGPKRRQAQSGANKKRRGRPRRSDPSGDCLPYPAVADSLSESA